MSKRKSHPAHPRDKEGFGRYPAEPSPAMIAAGEIILAKLVGEVTRATLATHVWRAMAQAAGEVT